MEYKGKEYELVDASSRDAWAGVCGHCVFYGARGCMLARSRDVLLCEESGNLGKVWKEIKETKMQELSAKEDDWQTVHSVVSYGKAKFGVQINVLSSTLKDFKDDDLRDAAYIATEKVYDALQSAMMEIDPDTFVEEEENRELLKLFHVPIYSEEVPNEYGFSPYYKHIPWFIVTTSIGRIKIGWRKRVINIDWSDTRGVGTAEDLFPDEDVTKGKKYIHAWGMEKAQEYLDIIIGIDAAK